MLRRTKTGITTVATHSMFRILRRRYSVTSHFKLNDRYKLKCGLEIHTQLNTKNKLFSASNNKSSSHFNSIPNSQVSFFDLALPGTQPLLNYEPILFATKLALSLNSEINLNSSFDRKHYFYADQPQGYQITQHYSPFAQHGHMNLFRDIDNIEQEQKRINITQLQIEQDTGKSTYLQDEKITLIDLNRSRNTGIF